MRRQRQDLEQVLADKTKVESALRAAVREALARHKKAGNAVAVWRDGKVIWLSPDAIPDGQEHAA
jgi:Arc/MetJ family transcription regulator